MYVYTHTILLAVSLMIEEFLASIAAVSVQCSESICSEISITLFAWNMLHLCHNTDGSLGNSTEWKCFTVVALFHHVDQIADCD